MLSDRQWYWLGQVANGLLSLVFLLAIYWLFDAASWAKPMIQAPLGLRIAAALAVILLFATYRTRRRFRRVKPPPT